MNDDIRQIKLPAQGETDLDSKDAATVSSTSDERSALDIDRTYQHDFDYKDGDTDPIIDEETDSPAEELGIPEAEFKDELDKYASGDTGEGDDDMREDIEDRDEDDDNAASTS